MYHLVRQRLMAGDSVPRPPSEEFAFKGQEATKEQSNTLIGGMMEYQRARYDWHTKVLPAIQKSYQSLKVILGPRLQITETFKQTIIALGVDFSIQEIKHFVATSRRLNEHPVLDLMVDYCEAIDEKIPQTCIIEVNRFTPMKWAD